MLFEVNGQNRKYGEGEGLSLVAPRPFQRRREHNEKLELLHVICERYAALV